jgi:hypothetical protein
MLLRFSLLLRLLLPLLLPVVLPLLRIMETSYPAFGSRLMGLDCRSASLLRRRPLATSVQLATEVVRQPERSDS